MSRFNKNFYNKVMGNDMKNDNSSVRNNETELSETVQPKSENEDNIAVSYQASFLESDSEQAINSNGNNVVFSKNLQPHNATDTCSANDTSQNTAFSEKTDTDLGVGAVTESNNEPKLIEIPIDEVNYAENNPFRVKDKTESGKLSIRELADSIECFWGNSKGIVVNENDDVPYNPTYDNARKLIIFPNNEVYLEMKTRQGKKLIPLSFTQITSGDLENKKFIEFLVYILRIKGREHKIYDKVATYYEKGSCVLFPEHIDELAKYNSFTELMANKYKTVQSLPKCLCTENDINSAYLILKTWGQVESEQRNKLLQARISDANDYVGMKCKDKVFTFIVEIIEKEILKYDYSTVSTEDKRKSLHQLVCDYVRMAKRTKQKFIFALLIGGT